MPAILVAAMALLMWSLQLLALAPVREQDLHARADAEATSFLAYHQAVSNALTRGEAVVFPPGFVTRPEWQHAVVDGHLFTFTDLRYTQPPGFASAVGGVGSRACLRAADGTDQAQCPHGRVPLPPAVAPRVAAGAVLIVGG